MLLQLVSAKRDALGREHVYEALVECVLSMCCQPLLALHMSQVPEALQVCTTRCAGGKEGCGGGGKGGGQASRGGVGLCISNTEGGLIWVGGGHSSGPRKDFIHTLDQIVQVASPAHTESDPASTTEGRSMLSDIPRG